LTHGHPEISWETSVCHTRASIYNDHLTVHETGLMARKEQHLVAHVKRLRQLEPRCVGLHCAVVAQQWCCSSFIGEHLKVFLRGQRLIAWVVGSSGVVVNTSDSLLPRRCVSGRCFDTSRGHRIDPDSIMSVLKSSTSHHHVELSHGHVELRVSWPWLLSCRGREHSDSTLSHSEERNTNRHYLHSRSDIDLILSVVIVDSPWVLDASHMPHRSVTKEDCIESAVKSFKDSFDLCLDLHGIL